MKATPLIINWHDQNAPVYSAHFEPNGKGRLATAGGDNHVRIWKVQVDGEERKVEYLSTLSKHNQAVNVVRWAPKGELLASAGDDGNVILWVPTETPQNNFGSEASDDKESWRAKHMCRSSGAEIYDLAWSPDGVHFIIGSMDNIARIYNAQTGTLVRQIAEHSHYVQGVTWDPLNEYIATQSSDRSVHIYSLKTKDGQYTLSQDDKTPRLASHIKADLPPRRISSSSPAPPDFGHRSSLAVLDSAPSVGSPVPSAPGTPTSFALPMNPPSVVSHSRRSSFSSRRSVSPAPSMPLPAVMPMDPSPKPSSTISAGLGMKNANLYANETLTSFFRRLTFTPDGSLLLTPSGQYQNQHQAEKDAKPTYEVINTVYIYTRGGINKPPIAHLPGHKKPSVVVKCSPIFYTLRQSPPTTRNITIDTSSAEEPIPSLPEPLSKPSPAPSVMDPPPPPATATSESKSSNLEVNSSTPGPRPAFSLPYRMVYAVATQDSVLLYDTQQKSPICVVSNLHCATFTDLAWYRWSDVDDIIIRWLLFFSILRNRRIRREYPYTNTDDQFCAPVAVSKRLTSPSSQFGKLFHGSITASVCFARFSTPIFSSEVQFDVVDCNHYDPVKHSNSGKVTGVPMTTPPETPRSTTGSVAGTKRDTSEGEREESKEPKKRRIAPTLVDPKA
ncbi:hypothetical protein LRP88_08817 [Fusarium phalaenopsidis]